MRVSLVGHDVFEEMGCYWVCWPGLLKCVACRNSWTVEQRTVNAVKAPQRIMVS